MTRNSLIILALCVTLGIYAQSGFAESLQLNDHYNLHESCNNLLNEQIGWELYASVVYMNMGGYFGRPTVAKPGYAKFFINQSQEEHRHAIKFMEYINTRNGTIKRITVDDSPKAEWASIEEALEDAIKLENYVYSKIHHIHDTADQKCLDRHLTGFLESDFFTEQVESIKQIQLLRSTINSSEESNVKVIEYLEDQKLAGMKDSEL